MFVNNITETLNAIIDRGRSTIQTKYTWPSGVANKIESAEQIAKIANKIAEITSELFLYIPLFK